MNKSLVCTGWGEYVGEFCPSWKIISKRPCHCYLQGFTTAGFSSNSRLAELCLHSPLIAGMLRSPIQKVYLYRSASSTSTCAKGSVNCISASCPSRGGGAYQWQICKLQLYGGLPMADLQAAPLGGSTNGWSASSNWTGVYQWQICKLQPYGGLPIAYLQAAPLGGSTNGRSASSNYTGVYQWQICTLQPYRGLPMADLQAAPLGGIPMAEL
jgi:hypothetical protein